MSDPVTRLNTALEGRYAIESELGEGGMATVYLADDLKHERKVALKVLKPELAAVVGAERFLAEIKTTANLTHPHILPLFDSGEAASFLFYVMPHVEGETLKERIKREKQLPVDEAVGIATAVANALDYAHRHKVIHRDIKPANILIQDGEPVVSDFGIALVLGAGGGDRLTETGLSLGTPFYMSPEQATGDQPVGSSTDTYALGSVLYEMLVGEPPYPGTTTQAVLGKIIAGKPVSAAEHRSSVPANVDAAIRCAIEKLPADRFGSVQEFAKALGDPGFRHGELTGVGSMHSGGIWNRVSIATIVLAIVVTAVTVSSLGSPEPGSIMRFTVRAPPGLEINSSGGLALSPDGRTVVFRNNAAPYGLFRRDLDRLEAVPLPGTENAWMPFFSPNGSWIAFFDQAENTLKRIRVDGSGAQTLGPAPASLRSAGWGEDGNIVFNSNGLGGLSRIAETGGDVRPVARGAGSLRWLDLLPGGAAVLGSQFIPVGRERDVVLVRLDTGEPEILFPGTTPRYVSTGHVVYWREGALWVVPFDVERLEVAGQPTLVAQGVGVSTNGFAWFAVTEDILIYEAGGLAGVSTGDPVWVDREGNQELLPVDPGLYAWPRISADGTKVALVRLQDSYDIWIHDVTSGVSTQLTFDLAVDYSPVWTPDSEHVVFRSSRDGPFNLYRRRADGTDEVERLTTSPADQRPAGFTPDGSLLFAQVDSTTGSDLWSMSMEVGATPASLMREAFSETQLSISPAGRFIAYESSELGYPEIFVRSFPDLGGRRMLSTLDIGAMAGIANSDPREARSPVWSRDGSEIFYRSGNAVLTVPVGSEDTFAPGAPEVVFEGGWANPSQGRQFDVSSDGQRFLMIRWDMGGDDAAPRELIVVRNWFEELRQRMGN